MEKRLCSEIGNYDDSSKVIDYEQYEKMRIAFKSLLADVSLMNYKIDCLCEHSLLDAEIAICRSEPDEKKKIISLENTPVPGKCVFVDFKKGWNNKHCFPTLIVVAPDNETGNLRVMGERLIINQTEIMYPHATALVRFGDYNDEDNQFDITFCGFISRGYPEIDINDLCNRIEILEKRILIMDHEGMA